MIPSDQFKPKCLTEACLGHSNKGYILPCCYVDAHFHIEGNRENDKLNALFDSSLKISNNDHIHDITMSDIWIEFYTMLQDESQEKPRLCVRVCDPKFDPKSAQTEMSSHTKTNPSLKFNQAGRKQEAKIIYNKNGEKND